MYYLIQYKIINVNIDQFSLNIFYTVYRFMVEILSTSKINSHAKCIECDKQMRCNSQNFNLIFRYNILTRSIPLTVFVSTKLMYSKSCIFSNKILYTNYHYYDGKTNKHWPLNKHRVWWKIHLKDKFKYTKPRWKLKKKRFNGFFITLL